MLAVWFQVTLTVPPVEDWNVPVPPEGLTIDVCHPDGVLKLIETLWRDRAELYAEYVDPWTYRVWRSFEDHRAACRLPIAPLGLLVAKTRPPNGVLPRS